MRMLRLVAVVLAVALALPGLAAEGRRLALVVGNDVYPNIPGGGLVKAVNDARGMAAALEDLGFEVIALYDQTQNDIFDAVVALQQRVRPGDTVMVFYAGHGVQIDGRNFLIPSDFAFDAVETKAHHYRRDAIALDWMLDEIQASRPAFTLAIVDACRNNPLRRRDGRSIGGSRGLAPPASSPQGTMIVYSAGAHQEALDSLGPGDPDPNGVFTRAFMPLMGMPGKTIQEVVWDAKYRVIELAGTVGHVQTPAIYDQSVGRFYFRDAEAGGGPSAVAVARLSEPPDGSAVSAEATEDAIEAEIRKRLAEMLAAERADADRRAREAAERAAREAVERVRKELEDARASPVRKEARAESPDDRPVDPPVTDCDRLAATAGDPDRVAPAVPDDAFDAAAAQTACEAALARYPGTARLHVQLARAAWMLRDVRGEPADGPMARLGLANERAAAELGHPLGQVWYGNSYRDGDGGVDRDPVEALRWFRLAAEQGLATAQNSVGFAYQLGRGVDRDTAEAFRWFRLAAEQGLASAQNSVGFAYQLGKGVDRDSAEALRWFRRAAEQGFAIAQNNVGVSIRQGDGTEQDPAEALRWFRQAADQGNADAQVNVGFAYQHGTGIDRDYAEALRWYRLAAEQGHARAQSQVGVAYQQGKGVDRDSAEAFRWFRLAADQGLDVAQGNIGYMYQNGLGVASDIAEALRWYRLAAAQGYALAQNSIGIAYQNGSGVDRDDAEALRWFRLAADQGYAVAQVNVGVAYHDGKGVDRDYAEALRWFRLAADEGNANAQSNIGHMYRDGLGVAQDSAEALRWYRLAAAQGHALAQNSIGIAYQEGSGVDRDYAEATRWFRLAADQGLAVAQSNIGYMYENGLAVAADFAEALRWYRLAAAQGIALAQNNVGVAYQQGKGVDRDYAEALRWLRLAADQGLGVAQHNVGYMYQNGLGVAADVAEALRLYRAAADNGYSLANIRIGKLYEAGTGVPHNEAAAVLWYVRARISAGTAQEGKLATQVLQQVASRSRTVLAQHLLDRLGYHPGPADGAMGPKTREALLSFQRNTDLVPTSEADTDTLVALVRAADPR